jgi:lipopolysaccharide export system protein LptA
LTGKLKLEKLRTKKDFVFMSNAFHIVPFKLKPVILKICFVVVVFLGFLSSIQAQESKQIEILNANSIEFNKKLKINARRLIGNVQFKHENAIMYCDSAYFYSEKNMIDAFGNVSIHQGDTTHLYGEFLKYDGNTKVAQIRRKVKLINKEIILTTEYLDYKTEDQIGNYINGGLILNGEDTLKSEVGYYFGKTKLLYFRKKVVIIVPKQYTIKSDTMKYNTVTKVAYFFGPTDITSKDNYIYCENGWYNRVTNISQFNKNAYLTSDKKLLKGDSLYYERNNGIGRAFKNIRLIDTSQQIIVTGNFATYREKPEKAMVTDSAVLMQYSEGDTMFVHADTMRTIADSANKEKTIRAFFHVKIFKKDMQGKCDSLTYTTSDSTMRLFSKPVLWTDNDQITSDYIELHMANQKLNTANLFTSSFITMKEDSNKYDQIKGRKMTGYFKDNELYKIEVKGNGQTIYYAKDKENFIGVNKAESSDMTLYRENKHIKKIVFLTKPDATLFPLNKAPKEEIVLKGFKWYKISRPHSKTDIFNWQEE